MGRATVDRLTLATRRGVGRLTPLERRAVGSLAVAWAAGVVLGLTGWDVDLAGVAERRIDPPLPSVAELAAELPAGDPRPGWYAAGLALRAELERARSGPAPLDPNAAGRADWDRLPGIGPRTAEAILEHRAAHGPFGAAEDLLAVRGIGPVTLARMKPWLRFPEAPAGTAPEAPPRPDLNRVDERFLAGLPGVGPHLATTIVRERRRRRGFRDWDDVRSIRGVGPARIRVLQDATRLEESRSPSSTGDVLEEGTR